MSKAVNTIEKLEIEHFCEGNGNINKAIEVLKSDHEELKVFKIQNCNGMFLDLKLFWTMQDLREVINKKFNSHYI